MPKRTHPNLKLTDEDVKYLGTVIASDTSAQRKERAYIYLLSNKGLTYESIAKQLTEVLRYNVSRKKVSRQINRVYKYGGVRIAINDQRTGVVGKKGDVTNEDRDWLIKYYFTEYLNGIPRDAETDVGPNDITVYRKDAEGNKTIEKIFSNRCFSGGLVVRSQRVFAEHIRMNCKRYGHPHLKNISQASVSKIFTAAGIRWNDSSFSKPDD